jgi:hypothetical protein
MSTGGTFQLVTNDGRMDTILTASNLLRDNITNITNRRRQQGLTDVNPTLVDLERSHVLFVNAHFKPYVAIALEYYKISANNVTLGTNVQMSIPQYGDFFADMVLNVVINTPTTGYTGTALDNSDVVLYKHCDYPGERLLQQTSFEVNSNPLDAYSYDAYVLHRQFRLSQDKRAGWNRCMGQESSDVGEYCMDETVTVSTAPVTARAKVNVFNGYQTYKTSHDPLKLWIPLLFWFNTDPRLAFPSVSVPYGQRFINFQLAKASDLYRVIVNPTSDKLTFPTLSNPQVATFDLYINNLFVLPEVHAIFIDRIAFTLIRVHRRQTQTLNKSADSIHLVQIKWPVEVFWIGFQPTSNLTSNATLSSPGAQTAVPDANMEDWHRYGVVTTTTTPAAQVNGASAKLLLKQERSHIQTLQLTAHGVSLFNKFPAEFFNSYIPYQYGGSNVNTPTDPGLYMISFSLYPGVYQPSGHFNASRARELYLDYTSSYIGSSTTATVFVNAQCINFILVTEGSATIRYST